MDEEMNLTDKNISIKTTNGTVVNVTCSYAQIVKRIFREFLSGSPCTRLPRH